MSWEKLFLLGAAAATVPCAMSDMVTLQEQGNAITVSLDEATMAYSLSISNVPWFTSASGHASTADGGYAFSSGGETFVASDGGLKPLGPAIKSSGTDAAGPYSSLAISWAVNRTVSTAAEWVTTFKLYKSRNAVVFEQQWPLGTDSGKGGTVFPALRQASPDMQLGTLEYCGSSCGFMVSAKGSFPGITGGSAKGYIVATPRDTTGAGAAASVAVGPVT